MKLVFKLSDSIQEIQSKIQHHFSHLKIEFYKNAHHEEEGSSKKEQIMHNVLLKEIYKKNEDIELEIDPTESTSNFEKMFEVKFGLHVQVFRLQHGTWIQTTHSDHLTLEEQNNKGLEVDGII